MYLAVMVNKICFNMNLRDAGFEDWKVDETGSRLSPKAGFGMTSVSPLYSIIRELLCLYQTQEILLIKTRYYGILICNKTKPPSCHIVLYCSTN